MSKFIEETVEGIVNGLIEGSELELVAVEYVRERDWYLRVFIDKEGGIEIDDCQELSGRLEEILDEKDFIPGSYILEVSSPGLDRELKRDKDFVREQGKAVEVNLFAPLDGQKQIVGILKGYDPDKRVVTVDELEIPMEKIAQIRLHIEF